MQPIQPIIAPISLTLAAAVALFPCLSSRQSAGQVLAAPTGPAARKLGTPIQYARFTFPSPQPLAEIVWQVAPGTGSARALNSKERALARGTVFLPTNTAMKVLLQYDALEHMDSIAQLSQCQVTDLGTAKLELTDEHLSKLKNFTRLANINLDETLITDKSLPLLATFTNLQELRLSGTDVQGEKFDCLSTLHKLTNLNLYATQLKKGCLSKLKPVLPQLSYLDITNTRVSKEDLANLQYLSNVTNLVISGNKSLDDGCAAYLSKLNNLLTLEITDTAMTAASLPVLTKLPKLKTIVVRDAKFWPAGHRRVQLKPGLKIVDAAARCRTPIEIFTPVH